MKGQIKHPLAYAKKKKKKKKEGSSPMPPLNTKDFPH
jgi:hypothetical protein